MKKTTKNFLIILLAFTVCVLCSCAEKNKLLDLNSQVSESQNFTFKTEHTEYDQNTKIISFTIKNISSEDIIVGDHAFSLHYKLDKKWKIVAFNVDENFYFYNLSRILKPNESSCFEIRLEDYFNLPLESGEYRIVKDGYASNVFKIK